MMNRESKAFYIYTLFAVIALGGSFYIFGRQRKRESELVFMLASKTKTLAQLQYKYKKLEQNDSLRITISLNNPKLNGAVKDVLNRKLDVVKRNFILRLQQGGCNQCVEGLLRTFLANNKDKKINLIILAKYTGGQALVNDIKGIDGFPNVMLIINILFSLMLHHIQDRIFLS